MSDSGVKSSAKAAAAASMDVRFHAAPDRAASQAAERLRASETEALDVQVTVLRQRLREEGVA